jgi:hypothetical protein
MASIANEQLIYYFERNQLYDAITIANPNHMYAMRTYFYKSLYDLF